MLAIETFGLTKYYQRGKIKALDDASLQVKKGTIYSLLGPNGAGKTTLIKLLLGIAYPTRGNGKILDTDISDHRIHAKIGYLAENHSFPDFLTAEQVLIHYGKMAGVNTIDLKSRIPELMKRVKLEGWEKTKIKKFSKGMLQRIGIAQALISEPEILFLDEPTDGIDPVGRREIRDILMGLRDEGKTIFLNSHLLSEVERISDEIAILIEGKVARQGKVEDFISVEKQFELKLQEDKVTPQEVFEKMGITFTIPNGKYVVQLSAEEQLNELIDSLRKENISIEAIIPGKISLEDFFIDVVEASESELR